MYNNDITQQDCLELANDCRKWNLEHSRVAEKLSFMKHSRLMAKLNGFVYKAYLNQLISRTPTTRFPYGVQAVDSK